MRERNLFPDEEIINVLFNQNMGKHVTNFLDAAKWKYEHEPFVSTGHTFKDRGKHTVDSIKLMFYQLVRVVYPQESKKRPALVGVKPSKRLKRLYESGKLVPPLWWLRMVQDMYGFSGNDYFPPKVIKHINKGLRNFTNMQYFADICQDMELKIKVVEDKDPNIYSKLELFLYIDGPNKDEWFKRYILAKPPGEPTENEMAIIKAQKLGLPGATGYVWIVPDHDHSGYKIKSNPNRVPDGNAITEMGVLFDQAGVATSERIDCFKKVTMHTKSEELNKRIKESNKEFSEELYG